MQLRYMAGAHDNAGRQQHRTQGDLIQPTQCHLQHGPQCAGATATVADAAGTVAATVAGTAAT
eukprot:4348099-Alexandrium_andersonii.AAC.1